MPLVLPRIPTTPAAAHLSFSDVRAHLRHAGTPVEAPINSSFTAKRVGQPTIGVPADKMAAFLKEMKSVRLRKVFDAPADMGREPPRVAHSADSSFVGVGIQRPPRRVEGKIAVGEKRKRQVDTLAKEDVQSVKRRLMGPLPRSADNSFSSTNNSFSHSQSRSQSQTESQSQSQSEAGPSKPSRLPLPVRAWPSSSVDGTDVTPSLTSDGDAEQGPDEPSPPTPPRVPAVVIQESDKAEGALSQPPPPPESEEVTLVPRPPTPPRRSRGISAQSLFDKRPPVSPLAPTPRKARPPSRTAIRPLKLDDDDNRDDDDEDDPLASAELDSPSPLTAVAARSRRERKPASTTTVKPPRQTRNRGNASTAQTASKATRQRRLTLDEELRMSDGVTEEDLRALDIEPHVLTAVGRGRQKGFLAHGGGAGVPVLVDAGGTDEDEDDEVEIIEPPPPPPPPPLQRKPKGRAAATRRR